MDVAATATDIERSVRAAGTPQRARGEQAYLKSDLEHCGAAVGDIRRITRAAASAHPDLTHRDFMDLVALLWARPVHDCRMAAIMLLRFRPDLVYAWLLPRAARASGVTLREAVKYLSPAQRRAILDASSRKTRPHRVVQNTSRDV